ncbi:MAG: hypothetical protein LBR53_04150 [Deltaproteobacteria bacterium]|nr:hypothetical protein [Deltaproteobacteria bacterium]
MRINAKKNAPGGAGKPGGGKRNKSLCDPRLKDALLALIEDGLIGEPGCAIIWTVQSPSVIAARLGESGHSVSASDVTRMVKQLGFRVPAGERASGVKVDADIDAQLRRINKVVDKALSEKSPVLSFSCDEARGGRIFHSLVGVGKEHDPASLAIASLRGWWRYDGRKLYKNPPKKIVLTADSAGLNSRGLNLWKIELQNIADDSTCPVKVLHFPPGAIHRWNLTESRLFSYVTIDSWSRPSPGYEAVVSYVSRGRRPRGIGKMVELDDQIYAPGRKVSLEEMRTVRISGNAFHGEWNYTVRPGGFLPSAKV